jgi:hypothetical protein
MALSQGNASICLVPEKKGHLFMFALCCDNKSEINYEIHHKPAPLLLDSSMKQMIDKLLWYIPNIDSYQSTPVEIIDDVFYDDFLFRRFLHDMQMQESDILWLSGNDEITNNDWEYYEEKVCTNCQKAIICAYSSQTKTKNFLRCIRNCIAHGQFAVVEDTLIGFSVSGSGDKQKKKAIVKIKPHLLLKALEHITLPSMRGQMQELIIADAFRKVGYEVLTSNITRYDFQISKNGCTYDVEIKAYLGKFIHIEDIQNYFERIDHITSKNTLVLIIDKSKLVKDVRNACKATDKLIVCGREEIQKLLKGEDILADENS